MLGGFDAIRVVVGAILRHVFLEVAFRWAEVYIAQLAHIVFLRTLSLVIEEGLGVVKVPVTPKVKGVPMRICCSPMHQAIFLAAKISHAGFAASPKVQWRSQYMLIKAPLFFELSITRFAEMSSRFCIIADRG